MAFATAKIINTHISTRLTKIKNKNKNKNKKIAHSHQLDYYMSISFTHVTYGERHYLLLIFAKQWETRI
jgi:hypothetical protein